MKKVLAVVAAVLVIVAAGGLAYLHSLGMFAGAPYFSTEHGAIDGYDPVAYFDQARAVRGEAEHSFEWAGARWRFASAENRDRFRQDPARFAPAYGGYCAFGMARGYTAKVDPEAWTIADGKLYLNFDADVQRQWSEERDAMIRQAEAKWPESRPARNAAEGP
jgi:YHS domain-containing protein